MSKEQPKKNTVFAHLELDKKVEQAQEKKESSPSKNTVDELEQFLDSQQSNEELRDEILEKIKKLDIKNNKEDRIAAIELINMLPSKTKEKKEVIQSLSIQEKNIVLAELPEERELKKKLVYDGNKKTWDGSNVRREGSTDVPYEAYVKNYNSKFKDLPKNSERSDSLKNENKHSSPLFKIKEQIAQEEGNEVKDMSMNKNGDSLFVEYVDGSKEKVQLDKNGKPFSKRYEEGDVTTHYNKDGSGKITQKDYATGYSVVGNDPRDLKKIQHERKTQESIKKTTQKHSEKKPDEVQKIIDTYNNARLNDKKREYKKTKEFYKEQGKKAPAFVAPKETTTEDWNQWLEEDKKNKEEKVREKKAKKQEKPIFKGVIEKVEKDATQAKETLKKSIEENAEHLLERTNFSEEARAYRRYMMFKETDSSQALIDDAYAEWQKAKERSLQKEEPVVSAEEAADENLRLEAVPEHIRAIDIAVQEQATTRAFHRMKQRAEEVKKAGSSDHTQDPVYKKYYDVWNSHKERLQKIYDSARAEVEYIKTQITSTQKSIKWMEGDNKRFTKPSMLAREKRKLQNFEAALPALIAALGEEARDANKTSQQNESKESSKNKKSQEKKEGKKQKEKKWIATLKEKYKKNPRGISMGIVTLAVVSLLAYKGLQSSDAKKENINNALREKVVPTNQQKNAMESDKETKIIHSIPQAKEEIEKKEEPKQETQKEKITHQKVEEKPTITHTKESVKFERHPSDSQIAMLTRGAEDAVFTKLTPLEGMQGAATVVAMPDGSYLLGFKSSREQMTAAQAAAAASLDIAMKKYFGVEFNQGFTFSEQDTSTGNHNGLSFVQITDEEARSLIKNFKQ